MSILGKDIDTLKNEYNALLIRYNNGIKYIETHPKELKKWEKELLKIMTNLDLKIHEIKFYCNYEMSDKEKMEGFTDEQRNIFKIHR